VAVYGYRPTCITANLLTLNSSKTEFLLIGLPRPSLAQINTSSLITAHSARNLGFIFDKHLTFSSFSAPSKSCYYHIRELRCIHSHLDFRTACTIATCIVHSKLDYCNSLYYNLSQSQIKRLQNIQNSLARAATRTPKSHITPVLKSLHWLKINERIKYKLLFLTYKVHTTNQPQYLHNWISVQPCHNTCSSSVVTLARLPTCSSLKITNRSFHGKHFYRCPS